MFLVIKCFKWRRPVTYRSISGPVVVLVTPFDGIVFAYDFNLTRRFDAVYRTSIKIQLIMVRMQHGNSLMIIECIQKLKLYSALSASAFTWYNVVFACWSSVSSMLKTKYVGKHNNGEMMKQANIALPVLPRMQLANLPCGCLYVTMVGKRKFQHIENGHREKIEETILNSTFKKHQFHTRLEKETNLATILWRSRWEQTLWLTLIPKSSLSPLPTPVGPMVLPMITQMERLIEMNRIMSFWHETTQSSSFA